MSALAWQRFGRFATRHGYGLLQRLAQAAFEQSADRSAHSKDNYRRTVKLTLPTFPLLSNARKETVCSPEAANGRSMV